MKTLYYQDGKSDLPLASGRHIFALLLQAHIPFVEENLSLHDWE